MKLIAERDALVEALRPSLHALGRRSALPILAGLRIEASDTGLEVAGTDLEIFVRSIGQVAVEEPGVAVVSGRMLNDILRSLPAGAVVVEGRPEWVTIRSGDVEFGLAALPADEFPDPPTAIDGPVCKLAAPALARALARVAPAASGDLGRPVLTGVLWALDGETVSLVATDSYRLAVDEVLIKEGPGAGQMIVPAVASAEFGRLLGKLPPEGLATVTIGQRQAALEAGTVRIVTRLIEGTYPDWRQLIPEGSNVLVVGREALASALERMALLARANIPVRLHLTDAALRLSATSTGIGEASEIVHARYDGDALTVGFNPQLLLDGLEAFADDEVRIAFIDPGRPAVLSEESSPFTYLVMPVRLWT